MPPCSGQSRPSPPGGGEDAASLDRPCARRLRELAVGMEEYSRRGSNQRMRPKRARKPTISNRWFSGNFSLALTLFPGSYGAPLPERFLSRLAGFADLFTCPTWSNVLLLLAGAVLASGWRTLFTAPRLLARRR